MLYRFDCFVADFVADSCGIIVVAVTGLPDGWFRGKYRFGIWWFWRRWQLLPNSIFLLTVCLIFWHGFLFLRSCVTAVVVGRCVNANSARWSALAFGVLFVKNLYVSTARFVFHVVQTPDLRVCFPVQFLWKDFQITATCDYVYEERREDDYKEIRGVLFSSKRTERRRGERRLRGSFHSWKKHVSEFVISRHWSSENCQQVRK